MFEKCARPEKKQTAIREKRTKLTEKSMNLGRTSAQTSCIYNRWSQSQRIDNYCWVRLRCPCSANALHHQHKASGLHTSQGIVPCTMDPLPRCQPISVAEAPPQELCRVPKRAAKTELLLIWRDTLLVVNLRLEIVYCVCGLHKIN